MKAHGRGLQAQSLSSLTLNLIGWEVSKLKEGTEVSAGNKGSNKPWQSNAKRSAGSNPRLSRGQPGPTGPGGKKAKALEEENEKLRQEQTEAEKREAKLQKELQGVRQALKRLEKGEKSKGGSSEDTVNYTKHEEELRAIMALLASTQVEKTQAEKLAAERGVLLEKTTQDADALQKEAGAAMERHETIEAKMSIEIERLEERVSGLDDDVARLTAERDSLVGQLEKETTRAEVAEAKAGEWEERSEAASSVAVSARHARDQAEEQVHQVRRDLEASMRERETEARGDLARAVGEKETQIGRLESKIAELEGDLERTAQVTKQS